MLIEYVKPNGATIKVNDRPETIKAAQDLGWKKKPKRKKIVVEKE